MEREHLLDEIARCFARATVDALFAADANSTLDLRREATGRNSVDRIKPFHQELGELSS